MYIYWVYTLVTEALTTCTKMVLLLWWLVQSVVCSSSIAVNHAFQAVFFAALQREHLKGKEFSILFHLAFV